MFSHVIIDTADFDRSRPWAGWQLPGQPRPPVLVGAPSEGEHAASFRDLDGNKPCVVCHEET